jgi:glycosyltransferase involved in cell wall biosynthesis
MKILICTQKVDEGDPNNTLGFFIRWLREFSAQCEQVTVIALGTGTYNLTNNVHIYSLGKEHGASRFTELVNFYRYIFRERKNYDAVFVHMNPEYVVLGGFFWRLMGKKVSLWYTHKNVDLKLRIAEKLTNIIFTSAPESFNLKSKKVKVLGHGIDVPLLDAVTGKPDENFFMILHVGRITKIKNLDVLIEAGKLLKQKLSKPLKIVLVGGPATVADQDYLASLKKQTKELGLEQQVEFKGNVPYTEVAGYMKRANVTVNLCPTGGLDKTVIESVVCGTPVFVANEAFGVYFGNYTEEFMIKYRDPEDLAEKILKYVGSGNGTAIQELQKDWSEKFGLQKLITKITKYLK